MNFKFWLKNHKQHPWHLHLLALELRILPTILLHKMKSMREIRLPAALSGSHHRYDDST
jgi:hypothetical protein